MRVVFKTLDGLYSMPEEVADMKHPLVFIYRACLPEVKMFFDKSDRPPELNIMNVREYRFDSRGYIDGLNILVYKEVG